MSELKKCPFCGSEAITTTFIDPDDFEYMPIEVNDCDAEVTCENERCINGWYLSPKAWNTRPIEDALNAENERLKEELQQEKTRSQLNLEAEERRMLNITYYCAEIDRLNARIVELEAFGNEITSSAQNLVDILPRDRSDWTLASLIHSIHKWEKIAQKERER